MGVIRGPFLAMILTILHHSEIVMGFTMPRTRSSSCRPLQQPKTHSKIPYFHRNTLQTPYGRTRRRGGGSSSPLQVAVAGAIPVESVANFLESFPYLAAFFTCGVKASAADAVAQVKDMKTTDDATFQKLRNVAFIIYGGAYQGMAQEYLYNHFLPILFGDGTLVSVVSKVCFDMLVLTPFLCLPMAYVVKGVVLQQGGILGGLQRYKTDVMTRGLLTKYWSLWAPVQCITFGVVPEHFRITFIAVVSFFWLIILSRFTSKTAEPRKASSNAPEIIKYEEEVAGDVCVLTDGLTCE